MTDEAFARAARTYGDTVYRVAYHALGSPHDAEDVMQTVLLRLYECKKEFESEEHMKHWLLRVAVNESRKLLRSLPDASVENRNGRTILVIDGEDVADVTDALNREERYEDTIVDENNQMHIIVEGTAENWTVTLSIDVPDGKEPFVITSDSEGNGSSATPAVSYEEDDSYVSSFEYDGETVAPIPEEK